MRVATGLLLALTAGNSQVHTVTEVLQPFGVEIGPQGALYITEIDGHRVLRFDFDKKNLETVASEGLNEPYEVRFDGDGNLFFVEMRGQVIRRVDAATKEVTLVAGTPGVRGFGGDGGPALKAQLANPHSIAIDKEKNHLYVADISNHRIRRVDLATGVIETVAGNGEAVLPQDGQIATGRPMIEPRALYIEGRNLWIALRRGHSVWRMNLDTRKLEHIAGTGEQGYSGDGGPALQATMDGPKGIAVGPDGRIYVVDTENHAIRVINRTTGRIDTLAGGDPNNQIFARPHGICVAPNGVVYVGDTNNNRVKAIR